MRKFVATACLLATLISSAYGQTNNATARIKTFIKAWGFLKYHHPLFATGGFDWDSVFVNNLQAIVDAKKPAVFNNKMLALIQSAGKAPHTTRRELPDGLFLSNKTTFDWIAKSTLLNNTVKKQLRYIYDSGPPDSNRYIKIVYETADFGGEKTYEGIGFPGMEYRLLFLSRFWNIINYFAPYKYLTTDWDAMLENFIPKMMRSNDTLSYYKTLQGLSKSLNDGHSQLARNGQMLHDLFFGPYTVPFYCEIVAGQVIVRSIKDSIANALNIRRGDVVTSVNGQDVNSIAGSRRAYISASNKADEDHQLSRFVLDGTTPSLALQLKRGNSVVKTTVARTPTQQRDWGAFINYTANDKGYEMLADSVLLVYTMQVWNGNIDTVKQLVKRSKAVIFDVRNYPSNDAFFYLPDAFLSEPKTIDCSTIALPQHPGLFKWRINPNKIGHASDSAYNGKVVILCDERTQSQGEYSCMVLQTIPGAVTIGSQTAGADGIVTNIPMGGGLTISYSGYGVYYPDKKQTQRVGVKIDIIVKKTADAIRDNRDEIMERALLYINNGK